MATDDIWSIDLTIFDGSKHHSIVSFNINGTLSYAQAKEWGNAVVGLLENIVDGDVRLGRISKIFGYFTAGSATEQSDVEVGAKFIWTVLGSLKKAINRIPTFRQGYMLTNSDVVDLNETNVAAFVNALTNGIDVTGASDVKAVDSENRPYDGVWAANESFQRTRKPARTAT